MQASLPADVLTWRLIVTSLLTLAGFLLRNWLIAFLTRFSRMEVKIDGIIRHLVEHAENGDREALLRLIGKGGD